MSDVKIECTRVALATGGATQDITISGFNETVKGAIFIATNSVTADNTPTADGDISIGMTDGTNEVVIGYHAEDAAPSANTDRWHRTDAVVYAFDFSGTARHAFSINSFITDGVRINVDNAAASGYFVHVILIGGDDVAGIAVGEQDDLANNAATNTTISDGLTLNTDPDLIFMTTIGQSTASPSFSTNAIITFGACINDGSETQRCISFGSRSGSGNVESTGYVSNNEVIGQAFLTSWAWGAAIDLFSNDVVLGGQFRVNPSAAAQNDIVQWMSIHFATGSKPNIALGSMNWPSAGNHSLSSLSFTPGFGLICAVAGPTAENTFNNSATDLMAASFMMFDDTRLYSVSVNSDDAAAVGVDDTTSNDSPKLIANDGSTTLMEATFDGFDSAGWDFTSSTDPTNDVLGFYLAVEEPTVAVAGAFTSQMLMGVGS